jgi:hypothetical protein
MFVSLERYDYPKTFQQPKLNVKDYDKNKHYKLNPNAKDMMMELKDQTGWLLRPVGKYWKTKN